MAIPSRSERQIMEGDNFQNYGGKDQIDQCIYMYVVVINQFSLQFPCGLTIIFLIENIFSDVHYADGQCATILVAVPYLINQNVI